MHQDEIDCWNQDTCYVSGLRREFMCVCVCACYVFASSCYIAYSVL